MVSSMASISLSSLPSPLEVAADLLVPEETPAISPLDGDVWEAAGAEEMNDCLLIISYYTHSAHHWDQQGQNSQHSVRVSGP